MGNTHIVQSTSHSEIFNKLRGLNIETAHFNNGTFMMPKDVFTPGFLAAYQRTLDKVGALPDDALIVAINSDQSMIDSYQGKPDEEDLIAKLIPETDRAQAVVDLLGAMHPDRKVVAVFYDESTPEELYSAALFIMKIVPC